METLYKEIPDEIEITKQIDEISNGLGSKLPEPNSQLEYVIIIPAKDEAEGITQTLTAIANQKNKDGSDFNKSLFEILLLCHNCNDETFETCQEFARNKSNLNLQILELHSEVANTVGSARRILMNIASKRIQKTEGFIISTDADTLADKYWLFYLTSYITSNYGLVCGMITVKPKGLTEQAKKYLKAKDLYLMLRSELESSIIPDPYDPWPRHSYQWGPNLAIKKSVYNKIGGIRPMSFLEDVDLYNRIASLDYKIRHCIKSKVTTSTRIEPRCEEGFGAELRVWSEMEGVEYNVEGLHKLLERFNIYKMIFELYKNPTPALVEDLSNAARTDHFGLSEMRKQAANPKAMIVQMDKHLFYSEEFQEQHPNTDVFEACEEIDQHLHTFSPT
ncbi:Glycosyl transferase family 2 [Flavobacteriaceae bacterium MAR_2010_188]|nr:Glycosyl transferase family 2 [Flavobacteriaceae bacterium MAR_2010_188]